MFSTGLRSIFRAAAIAPRNRACHQAVRHYTKHECEGRGFRRFLGPFWVLTTPVFLHSYAVVGTFFLIFLYPLDSALFNVRRVKAELDSKVAG
ncbi:hypothetical protein, conserved [Babesia bigemina]|uniref:Uncharacterized protein n=1 Tax=Babesia bigemina TaxID=5866 RepID=A0A061D504_BABBI|nr:hypothetical protein, conserved [Babesia bigemina]CDR95648.1 hypothetical protein, conserved [Babesia bigemina]|eukprot:XP_012767834.1 hypothetical protein, conserved [Babesia bigemina]